MILEIFRGDDATYEFVITDSEGNAIDISGSTIFFTVKEYLEDDYDKAVISKEITTHSDPTNGKTKMELSETETDLKPKEYYYDVVIDDTASYKQTLTRDIFKIKFNTTNK